MELQSSDNDTLGVMFRYTSTSNYYRFSMDAERSNRRLAKVRNGAWTTLWEDTGAYQLNRTYALEIIANGSTLTVKLDGVQLWSGTDTNALTSGTIALYSWQNTGAEFDNVLVRNLAAPLSNLNEPKHGIERLRMEAPVLASARDEFKREPRPEPPPVPRAPPERLALMLSTHRPIGEGAVR